MSANDKKAQRWLNFTRYLTQTRKKDPTLTIKIDKKKIKKKTTTVHLPLNKTDCERFWSGRCSPVLHSCRASSGLGGASAARTASNVTPAAVPKQLSKHVANWDLFSFVSEEVVSFRSTRQTKEKTE